MTSTEFPQSVQYRLPGINANNWNVNYNGFPFMLIKGQHLPLTTSAEIYILYLTASWLLT